MTISTMKVQNITEGILGQEAAQIIYNNGLSRANRNAAWAVIGTNNLAGDAIVIRRTPEKDTITLNGDWFILMASDTAFSTTKGLRLTRTSKTFECIPGRLLYLNIAALNALTGVVDEIPDSAYGDGEYTSFRDNPDIIPVYMQWYNFNYGILADIVNQKQFRVTGGLNGMKWASLGDSITFQEKWQPYLYNKYGILHTNCGIGSTTLAGDRSNAFWQAVRLNAVKAADPDVVTILGGGNDIVDNVPIGDDTQYITRDTNTFKGAYSYIINDLLTWKPSLRIVILTTTWAHDDGRELAPSSGLLYTDYAKASAEVAAYFGLRCVDLHGEGNFNAYTQNLYFPDHIHPNEAGGKLIAEIVEKQFLTLFSPY